MLDLALLQLSKLVSVHFAAHFLPPSPGGQTWSSRVESAHLVIICTGTVVCSGGPGSHVVPGGVPMATGSCRHPHRRIPPRPRHVSTPYPHPHPTPAVCPPPSHPRHVSTPPPPCVHPHPTPIPAPAVFPSPPPAPPPPCVHPHPRPHPCPRRVSPGSPPLRWRLRYSGGSVRGPLPHPDP